MITIKTYGKNEVELVDEEQNLVLNIEVVDNKCAVVFTSIADNSEQIIKILDARDMLDFLEEVLDIIKN